MNPRNGFFGSFVSSVELGMPRPGPVAILSQSGAYGGHLLAAAVAADIGLSSIVMTGNEADLTLGDVVQMMVDDADTQVIAVYSEGIRASAGLVAALEAARRARKPVVMMKVGRSVLGAAAAQSHTASIAGNDRVTDAVLAELGVVRARNTARLLGGNLPPRPAPGLNDARAWLHLRRYTRGERKARLSDGVRENL